MSYAGFESIEMRLPDKRCVSKVEKVKNKRKSAFSDKKTFRPESTSRSIKLIVKHVAATRFQPKSSRH
jgi:hypothetical protein